MLRVLFISVYFFFSLAVFSQLTERSPKVWLSSLSDQSGLLDSGLNGYEALGFSKDKHWFMKDKLGKGAHVFFVYVSGSEDEFLVSILGLRKGFFVADDSAYLGGDSVVFGGGYKGRARLLDVSLGNVGSHVFYINNRLSASKLYEIVAIDGANSEEVQSYRTYLSIKYGLDLVDKNYYYPGIGSMWGGNDAYHIVGVGRFDKFLLNQRRSRSQGEQRVELSCSSSVDLANVSDGSYVLLGDNGKSMDFNSEGVNNRRWKIESRGLSAVDLYIGLPEEKEKGVYGYVLEVLGNGYKGEYERGGIIFRSISLRDGNFDVVLKRERSGLEVDFFSACSEAYVHLMGGVLEDDVLGVKVYDSNKNELSVSYLSNLKYKVDEVRGDYVDVEVSLKSGGQYMQRYATVWSDIPEDLVKDKYVLLLSDKLEIDLPIGEGRYLYFLKQGEREEKLDSRLIIKEPGNYSLRVVNEQGCERLYSFEVERLGQKDANMIGFEWEVYPNPVSSGEVVTCVFRSDKKRHVELYLYQSDGKLVQRISKFDTAEYKEVELRALSSGVYILAAHIEGEQVEVKKIIVK